MKKLVSFIILVTNFLTIAKAHEETTQLSIKDTTYQSYYKTLLKESDLLTYYESQYWANIPSNINLPDQGWKLHISAKTESALKIAQLVFPLLIEHVKGTNPRLSFKFITSISHLRKLQLSPTQKGKFITIYMDPEYQINITTLLDSIISTAFKERRLNMDDFEAIPMDAKLGHTGALFTRYGVIAGKPNLIISQYPDQTSMSYSQLYSGIKDDDSVTYSTTDDRTIPWPDFMNSVAWRNVPSPFGEVSLTFKHYTWQTRPFGWHTCRVSALMPENQFTEEFLTFKIVEPISSEINLFPKTLSPEVTFTIQQQDYQKSTDIIELKDSETEYRRYKRIVLASVFPIYGDIMYFDLDGYSHAFKQQQLVSNKTESIRIIFNKDNEKWTFYILVKLKN